MNPYSSAHSPTESVRQASDVLLCLDSADRGVSQSVTGEIYPTPITQPYNNFILQKPQALVQGGIKRLKLNEVRFPYVIPNVVGGVTDSIWFTIYPASPPNLTAQITITSGWRTGAGIASQLASLLNANATIGTAATGNIWTATYDYAGGFQIDTSSAVGSTGDIFSMSPINPALIGTVALPAKSLLSVIGFDVINNYAEIVTEAEASAVQANNFAPLTFTQYIDIVSVNLTRFQTIADTNTRQNSRGNLICRLFIADENSALPQSVPVWDSQANAIVLVNSYAPAGSLPFTIHRQFQEPKVFRWENEASINAIDISLYDDVGNLLVIPDVYRSMANFQISFKCSEE
jgi:hypothetical protein